MLIKESLMGKVVMMLIISIGTLWLDTQLHAQKKTDVSDSLSSKINILKDSGLVIILIPNSRKKNELLENALKNSSGKKKLQIQKKLDESLSWRDTMFFSIFDAFHNNFNFCDFAFALDSDVSQDKLDSGTIDVLIDKEYNKQRLELPEFYLRIYRGLSSNNQYFDSNWYCIFPKEEYDSNLGKRDILDQHILLDTPINFIRRITSIFQKRINRIRPENITASKLINAGLHRRYNKGGGKILDKK